MSHFKFKLASLIPLLGAAGFIVGCEYSLHQPTRFLLWSLATVAWILLTFAVLARGKLKGRFLAVSIPAVVMIAVSTTTSLLFLDLVSPRRWFVVFFAAVLFLFLEHVRHEVEASSDEERQYLAEYARAVNIGSLFLVATAARGLDIFSPIPWWSTVLFMAAVALAWSWHLCLACVADCDRSRLRIALTALTVLETYLVVMWLPVSMFVGGATVALAYYLAAMFLPLGASTDPDVGKRARRYALMGAVMLALIYVTARWIE
jgi:hypothetical protein